MASFLLAAGAKGKRYALPHARVMIHQPLAGFQGQATDIEIHAREILKARDTLNELYAKHTGQPSRRSSATPSATTSCPPQRGRGLRPDRRGPAVKRGYRRAVSIAPRSSGPLAPRRAGEGLGEGCRRPLSRSPLANVPMKSASAWQPSTGIAL